MKKITLLFILLTVSLGFAQTPEGTWKMNPAAGALGVGPNQGDTSWWSNAAGDVTTRACYFDDEFVFNQDASFDNANGADTWVEGWQDGMGDGCRASVAPHDGSNVATWAYDSMANTITLTGVGAYLGLAKAYNGGELTTPANAPASITYTVTELTASSMTLDINIGGGWWRFVLQKQGTTPTCDDGIQNGDETGVDCGGSCPNACLDQVDLPVNFEDGTTDYTVTDFGGNASSMVEFPASSGNMAIQTIKTVSAETWAGTTIGTATGFATNIPINLVDSKMYVRVWSPDSGIPVRLKIEDANDNTHTCETETNTTTSGEWELIEFDFANEAPGTATLSNGLSNGWVYNKASIFFNFGTSGADARTSSRVEKTYYFDAISFSAPVSLELDEYSLTNFNVYPNPTQNEWNIKTDGQDIISVQVYDILGKNVISVTPSSTTVKLDATGLPAGLYFARLSSEAGTKSVKLVKQ